MFLDGDSHLTDTVANADAKLASVVVYDDDTIAWYLPCILRALRWTCLEN